MSEDITNEMVDIVDSKVLMGLNPRYWSSEAEDNFNNSSVIEDFKITNIKFLKYDVFKSEFTFRINYIYKQYDKITNELVYTRNANGQHELYVTKKDNDWYISAYRPSL